MPDPALGGWRSADDELVRYKVDELINQYDEERIVHERSRQEQLRELDRDKKAELKNIVDEANEELEYVAERIKHEIIVSQEGGIVSEEKRKKELQEQMHQAVSKVEERERIKYDDKTGHLKEDHNEKIRELKEDVEHRHNNEVKTISNKFKQKLEMQKERV